ncbi:hypothetical protein V499_03380 [Pseudogymnoascus sp. VKM F-103]|uniref:Bromo domain-containing protein n=1 Tax=Pseudogymnoascus verrucosus TaxID=342668 RepID=A0A1B8G8Y8_9PEZI|nr:uncharacterized protein VE01_09539 [Pseudogymnoascus verrucosus]KFY77175.1 hypothetical protein V499_03380 [Pseudogymnoascus sp. VKM F-103]OBT92296.1 hypothetical protein VE01_09539 [Pseudogymnoascus verrucosus]
MNNITAYTPLESLLLFQSLAVFGTEANVFARISDLLKNNILIRDGDRYDPGRLSPDSLRELYLQLLREELKSELEAEIPGDASPSKKRKIQSPPLPTIKDAKEYSGKLPQLVDRLYARYRDQTIQAIRDDERRYDVLKRELKEIERGEWDERIMKDERRGQRTTSEDSRRAPSVPVVSEKPERPASRGAELQAAPAASPLASPRTEPRHEGLAISDVLNTHEVPASPRPLEKDTVPRVRNVPPINHHRTPSTDRPHGPSPLQPGQRPPPLDRKWENYQPPPTQPYSPHAPTPQGYSPYPQGQYAPVYPQRGSFSGPLPPARGPVPSSPHAAQPLHLPPQGQQGPGSPAKPLDQLAEVADQQYRPPQQVQGQQMAQYPPTPGQQMGPYPPGPGLQVSQYSPAQYAQPPPQQPFRSNGQHPQGQLPAQWNQYQQLPPANYYPAPGPQPGQRPFPVRPEIAQPEQRQYNSPYNPSGGQPPAFKSTPAPKPLLRDTQPNTPVTRPILSTGRATRWTPVATPGTPKASISPDAPAFEPLSPQPKSSTLPKDKGKKPRGRPPRIREGSTASPAPRPAPPSQAPDAKVKKETPGLRPLQDLALATSAEDTAGATTDETPAPPSSPLRKRKRSPARAPSKPPTHVLWTRNFSRISASALERIGAHRCASTFANPIKERDAPGYKDVILRPQDLKSIRSAITAGSRAGLAAVASMDEESDKGQASLQLPISEELVPPKGIVNNAQLEKELMLMFANAIMFNPDPDHGFGRAFSVRKGTPAEVEDNRGYTLDEDGVVQDTKTMFADVEKIVGELRSAEQRKSEEKEGLERRARESESVDDADQEGPGKKRKRG